MLLPIILVLAAASGAAALVYEIVWFQMLELVIGSTAVSLAVLLATFMGGMCLGSLLLPRVVSSKRSALGAYATIEFGIGVLGLFVLFTMPWVNGAYTSGGGGLLFRSIVAAGCLAAPTILMGATLPLLARTVPGSMGLLYAANIAGAVFGALAAGFYLLPNFDAGVATYVAAGSNFAIAAVALCVGRTRAGRADFIIDAAPSAARAPHEAVSRRLVLLAIGLSGFCALGAETIWTRLLALLFGGSVYAFSVILAVFLFGLGGGSVLGSLITRITHRSAEALAWCQILAAAATAWSAFHLNASLPYWPIDPSISTNLWFNFALDLCRAAWTLLPATILWGASFPLALAAAGRAQSDGAYRFASVYAANTAGAIAGALVASLLMIGWFGSQRTQQVLIGLAAGGGLLLLKRGQWPATAMAAIIGGLSIYSVPPISKPLVAHGRFAASWVNKGEIVYAEEGLNASVAVSRFQEGATTFHVAGKIQASNVPRDLRLQRMLGHFTTLLSEQPASVLVIGHGAGVTAGAVSIDPRVLQETIVEIEPLVPRAAAAYFSRENFDVLNNPKVRVRIDDGRHYLLTSKEHFDGITVDPLDPWAKGAASLYTREFLESMKEHLNPGGVATLYVQLFETTEDAVKSIVATFFEVFPYGTVWGNTYQGRGYDMILLGQNEAPHFDLDKLQDRLYGPGARAFDPVVQSLAEVGIGSPVELFATYAARKSDLVQWLKGASINTDRNLRMQYLAGLGANLDDSGAIYEHMLTHRKFPHDLFSSQTGMLESLRAAVEKR